MTDRIEKSINLKAPIDKVWQALADSQEFGRWFKAHINDPFVAGQPASGHITYPGYEHIRWEATIRTMEEPNLFSFTWHPYAIDPAMDYSRETPTLVAFQLAPHNGGTRLTVTETGFDAIPAIRRAEAYDMHDKGWDEQLRNIQAHVET